MSMIEERLRYMMIFFSEEDEKYMERGEYDKFLCKFSIYKL